MSLPPLITKPQYEARVRRTLDTAETAQFEAFAEDASGLVRNEAGQDFLDGEEPPGVVLPDGILPIVFRVVDRAMENRLGLDSVTQGNFTWRKDTRGPHAAVYLTDDDRDDIRDALEPGASGVAVVSLSNFPLPGA